MHIAAKKHGLINTLWEIFSYCEKVLKAIVFYLPLHELLSCLSVMTQHRYVKLQSAKLHVLHIAIFDVVKEKMLLTHLLQYFHVRK